MPASSPWSPIPSGAATSTPEVCRRLLSSTAAVADGYRGLGAQLDGRGNWTGTVEPGPVRGSIDRSNPDATMTLLELEAWLTELAVDLERAELVLGGLGLGVGSPRPEPSPSAAGG